jgi:hypothetical protein
MKTILQKIETIKIEGYELDFGDVFSNGFEIYKKIAGIAGIAFLILTLVFVSLFMGVIAAVYGFTDFASQMTNFNIANFSTIGVLIYLLTMVLVTGFMAPFSAGIVKMAYCVVKNEPFSLTTAFEYYKSDRFKDLFIAAVIITFFSAGINIALEYSGIKFFGVVIAYLISFITFLTIPLIIFGNLSATQAIQNSILLVSKKPIVIAGLLLLTILLSMFGIIGFCLGIFFTIPLIYAIHFAIYDAVIGTDKSSELDQIGSFVE